MILGLGGGKYPYDINVALVPSSLLAIQRLSDAGIIDSGYAQAAKTYRTAWEAKALQLFQVDVKEDDAKNALTDYLKNITLPSSMVSDYKHLPKKIHALSLKDNGKPVPVINSDFSFNLLYHDEIDSDYLHYVVDALQVKSVSKF